MLAAHLISTAAQTPAIPWWEIPVAVVCAVLGARMATRRGRPAWQGVLFGFCCGLIGLVILAVLPRRDGNAPWGPSPGSGAQQPTHPGPFAAPPTPGGPPPTGSGFPPSTPTPGSPQGAIAPGSYAPPRVTDLNPNRVFPLEPPPGMLPERGDGGTWEVDPWAHYPSRWWDGTRWTEHVADGDQAFHVDPI